MYKYNNLFSTITPLSSYWLGMITSDGYLSSNRKVVGFGLKSEDIYHVQQFKDDIAATAKICISKKDGFGSLQITSKELYTDLLNLNLMPKKSRKLTSECIPHIYTNCFILGLFDGDGSVGLYNVKGRRIAKPRWSICGHKPLLEGIKQIFDNLGIKSYICPQRAKLGVWVIQINKKDSLIKLYEYLYSDSPRYLKRKKIKFKEIYDFCHIQHDRINKSKYIKKGNKYFDIYICKFCNLHFEARSDKIPKFCSRICCIKNTQKLRHKQNPNRKYLKGRVFILKSCKICKNTVWRRIDNQSKFILCSNKCKSTYMKGKKNAN